MLFFAVPGSLTRVRSRPAPVIEPDLPGIEPPDQAPKLSRRERNTITALKALRALPHRRQAFGYLRRYNRRTGTLYICGLGAMADALGIYTTNTLVARFRLRLKTNLTFDMMDYVVRQNDEYQRPGYFISLELQRMLDQRQ